MHFQTGHRGSNGGFDLISRGVGCQMSTPHPSIKITI